MEKAVEIIRSLTEASRNFREGGANCTWMVNGNFSPRLETLEEHFETELVRAEDYLEEVKRNADTIR